MQNVDPDIYLGYNITNFDFPYILERGKQLGINGGKYGFMGRIKSSITRIKEGKYLSKAMGMRDVRQLDSTHSFINENDDHNDFRDVGCFVNDPF